MPTYEYLCKSCGKRLEVQQRFSDESLTECPYCEGPLRKVFGSVGIAFKGSGFYKTDSRGTSKSTSEATAGGESSTSTATSESSPSSDASSSSSESTAKPSDSSKSAAATTTAS